MTATTLADDPGEPEEDQLRRAAEQRRLRQLFPAAGFVPADQPGRILRRGILPGPPRPDVVGEIRLDGSVYFDELDRTREIVRRGLR